MINKTWIAFCNKRIEFDENDEITSYVVITTDGIYEIQVPGMFELKNDINLEGYTIKKTNKEGLHVVDIGTDFSTMVLKFSDGSFWDFTSTTVSSTEVEYTFTNIPDEESFYMEEFLNESSTEHLSDKKTMHSILCK